MSMAKSKSSHPERLKALIERNIRDIVLFEIRNPKIGMVSINEVRLNSDNSEAKVYVTFLGAKYPHQAFMELKKTEGFVRSSLAKKVAMYKVPKVIFVYDESFEEAASLEKKLAQEASDLEAMKHGGE